MLYVMLCESASTQTELLQRFGKLGSHGTPVQGQERRHLVMCMREQDPLEEEGLLIVHNE